MPVQRVTCEPCRLRRVKCDLREKVSTCSNCVKRNLRCPGIQRAGSRKPRRGNVVDRVEREYGDPSSSPKQPTETSGPSSEIFSLSTSASEPVLIITAAERNMVSLELGSELIGSLLASFMISHGNASNSVLPQLDLRKCFETLGPIEEVTTRLFVALGARTTMHSAIIGGADTSFPFTLGVMREGPCQQLARMAVERFESLGLGRQPTPEVIRVAMMVVYIARSAFTVEFCRPLVNTAVHLMRQYYQSQTYQDGGAVHFALSVGPSLLWIDARCAAEMGNQPLFTADDLDDIPSLREWLLQPLPNHLTLHEQKSEMLNAASIRLLRSFAADFHKPIRRGQPVALESLPRIWEAQANLATHVSLYMSACADHLATLSVDDELYSDASYRFNRVLQIDASISLIALSAAELLRRAVTSLPSAQLYYLMAEKKARLELKRVAEHIQVVQRLCQGPSAWTHMCRLFYILNSVPTWTRLLADGDMGSTNLTGTEAQLILDGIQEAGWGAGFAPKQWCDALTARGILSESSISALEGEPDSSSMSQGCETTAESAMLSFLKV